MTKVQPDSVRRLMTPCSKCGIPHESECIPGLEPKKQTREQKILEEQAAIEWRWNNSGLMGGLIGEDDDSD